MRLDSVPASYMCVCTSTYNPPYSRIYISASPDLAFACVAKSSVDAHRC